MEKSEGEPKPGLAVDPILRLAVFMHHNKGVYALLLGSGVSRSAGIPTGWEITLDLIRQLAAANGETLEPGAEVAWYENAFGQDPGYGTVLDQVGGSKVERSRTLARYIEPSDEDAAAGVKVPQEAHRAIARLAREGYVRLIVTTNFDHLLEDALRQANVIPRIVATPEAIEQALPLVHEGCTVIKVHGDYTSGDLKNTTEELAEYDDRLKRLLEQVFSDFGLIVCGWSARWDGALRAVFGGAASRAYSTFWIVKRGSEADVAESLFDRPGKAMITVDSADGFFQTLEEKVSAVREVLESESLTPAVARAIMKRYLADPHGNRIRVRGLVAGEVETLLGWLGQHEPVFQGAGYLQQELSGLHEVSSTLLAMVSTGCRWGGEPQNEVWSEVLARLLNSSPIPVGIHPPAKGLSGYASVLVSYAGGLSALAGNRYDPLRALLETSVVDEQGAWRPAVEAIAQVCLLFNLSTELSGKWARGYGVLSNHVDEVLRPRLSDAIPDDAIYQQLFGRFEYLLALVYVDARGEAGERPVRWAPVGQFFWRHRYTPGLGVMHDMHAEAAREGNTWPPLKAGFFGGDADRFQAARDDLDAFMQRLGASNP